MSIDASQLQIMVLSESMNPSDSEKDWAEDKMHSAVNEFAAKICMTLGKQMKSEAWLAMASQL
jgi:hypothetical protein